MAELAGVDVQNLIRAGWGHDPTRDEAWRDPDTDEWHTLSDAIKILSLKLVLEPLLGKGAQARTTKFTTLDEHCERCSAVVPTFETEKFGFLCRFCISIPELREVDLDAFRLLAHAFHLLSGAIDPEEYCRSDGS